VGQFFASSAAYADSPRRGSLDFVAVGVDTMLLAQTIHGHVERIAAQAVPGWHPERRLAPRPVTREPGNVAPPAT
jgi:hypothetical protein